MLGNLANALVAITDGKGDRKQYLAKMREEAVRCLEAARLPLEEPDSLQERINQHRYRDPETSPVRTLGSSWQSLVRKQGSIEADFLNGEIVRLGRKFQIPTPYNELLQRISGNMARIHELPGRYTEEQLMEMVEESNTNTS